MGGMVRQYQVRVDPDKLRAYGIPLSPYRDRHQAGQSGDRRLRHRDGGSGVHGALEWLSEERGGSEADPARHHCARRPLLLGDVADVVTGPQSRRGLAELNGEGGSGGRHHRHALRRECPAHHRRGQGAAGPAQISLPDGVEVVTVYDRSDLIQRAIDNLSGKLVEEFAVVVLVCLAFLFHLRSSLVVVISLPIAILTAFIVMHLQGINANIMSLGASPSPSAPWWMAPS